MKKHQNHEKPEMTKKGPQKHQFWPLCENTKKEAKNTKF